MAHLLMRTICSPGHPRYRGIRSGRSYCQGVIVGNATTQMLVLSDKEVLAEGSTTIVERYEMLQLGIAIQAGAILSLHSDLLGRTLAEHLRAHGML